MRSYGTGSVVKLPGPGPDQPNVYEFGTTYQFMCEDLYRKDPHLYLPPTHSSLASGCNINVVVLAKVFMAVALFSEIEDLFRSVLFQCMCGRSCAIQMYVTLADVDSQKTSVISLYGQGESATVQPILCSGKYDDLICGYHSIICMTDIM